MFHFYSLINQLTDESRMDYFFFFLNISFLVHICMELPNSGKIVQEYIYQEDFYKIIIASRIIPEINLRRIKTYFYKNNIHIYIYIYIIFFTIQLSDKLFFKSWHRLILKTVIKIFEGYQ